MDEEIVYKYLDDSIRTRREQILKKHLVVQKPIIMN